MSKRRFSRHAPMPRIFPKEDENLSARVARLCVLYEDLGIELYGIESESIPVLDRTNAQIRVHYFLRRSIATLHEFSEGIRHLNGCADFLNIVERRFDTSAKHRWKRAVRFFERTDDVLRKVRNDVGGHFGLTAALHAVRNMQATSVGSIEGCREWRGDRTKPLETQKLHFAGEVAACAFFRHLEGNTREQKARYFERKLVLGYQRAAGTVNSLVNYVLIDRFG